MSARNAWLIWLCLPACGYTFGSGMHERGVRTVAIRAVDNHTYRQRLDVELTAAIEETLVASSDLLPAAESRADAVLHVVINADREQTLVVGSQPDPVREGALEISAEVRLVSRRDGQVLLERTLADRAEFRDPIGEDLASTRRELVSDLARRIVLALETAF